MDLMQIIWTIVIGFFAGVVAKFIMPGKQGGGFVITTILGIVGAMVGSFIAGALGLNLPFFILAVLGALLVLFIYGLVTKGK